MANGSPLDLALIGDLTQHRSRRRRLHHTCNMAEVHRRRNFTWLAMTTTCGLCDSQHLCLLVEPRRRPSSSTRFPLQHRTPSMNHRDHDSKACEQCSRALRLHSAPPPMNGSNLRHILLLCRSRTYRRTTRTAAWRSIRIGAITSDPTLVRGSSLRHIHASLRFNLKALMILRPKHRQRQLGQA